MKLTKRQMLPLCFMLFSLFFGAGNLIFPPFLGQMAGKSTLPALLGFCITAVILPVLGVIVVSEFDGLEKLARKVNPKFALVFTILIYLSIGPGLGIPRAASVPFEMAIAPYFPEGTSTRLYMVIYSLIFFMTATWLALTPRKLIKRLGKVLTPTLLVLMTVLFMGFLFKGQNAVAAPQESYAHMAVVTGFLEGYNTMDAIAALNFGLVIAATLKSLQVTDKKELKSYTIRAGIGAGTILALIYAALSYMGMKSSAVYELKGNGAWTLRCIVKDVFGDFGAILLATIFTLACLTTCVGLITSISQYFSSFTTKISYKKWAFAIGIFSFLVCNQGLNTILSISVPVLNAIYPIAIMLIILGLFDKHFKGNKYVYPLTITATGLISIIFALDKLNVPLGFLKSLCSYLPFFSAGMGWVTAAVVMVVLSLILFKHKETEKA